MKFKTNNEINKKKHKNGLSPFLSYGVDVDKEAAHFNNATAAEGGEMSEAWEAPHGLTYNQYKAEIKKRRPGYTFDRLDNSKNREAVAFRTLDRIIKQDKDRALKRDAKMYKKLIDQDKPKLSDSDILALYNGNEIYFKDGYYYLSDGTRFERESDVIDYLEEI